MVASRKTRTLSKVAAATLCVALLLGASLAAADYIDAPEMNDTIGNATEMENGTIAEDENLAWGAGGSRVPINLAPELNETADNMTEMANDTIADDETDVITTGRRSLLDGGIPLTVEGSDTTTSLGDELEGLLPHMEKIPPQGLDMAPLAELEAEAPAFENSPSGVAGVDFAAGPESSASEDPAPSGEASPAEGDMTMDDTMPMMNMTMNGTDDMGNMSMDASDEMANDTIAEDPEEMPASDDARRKLY